MWRFLKHVTTKNGKYVTSGDVCSLQVRGWGGGSSGQNVYVFLVRKIMHKNVTLCLKKFLRIDGRFK